MNQTILMRHRIIYHALALALCIVGLTTSASAQWRRPVEQLGDKLVDIKVGEVTLESINLREQTASLSVRLDVSNPYLPVKLKDFAYRLSLFDRETIVGHQPGTTRLGGRGNTRIDLPVTVNLRSIPDVLWSAFSNRGRVNYRLDTDFTVPLFIMDKRFEQSFSGELPLRTLVEAATILLAICSSRVGLL